MTNLVFIDCHDLGQHIGAYGWKTVPSKYLDSISQLGVRFENSFCTAPQCSPSRSSLYTGRYPHANGMFGLAHNPFNWRLKEDEIHLASHLKNVGFSTLLIGAQHVTGHDEQLVKNLGFQETHFATHPKEVATLVENYLDSNPSSPFFLNIGFIYPHRDDNGEFKWVPPDNSLGVEVPPYLPKSLEAELEFAELQGVIKEMDMAVGRIWDALRKNHLLDDTWFIFTTDHGVAMPRAKCTLYDPGIETALIMYAKPFGLIGGKVFPQMISNVDIVPTILEMLELPIPNKMQGKSFAALLKQEVYTERQELFAEKTFHTAYEPQRSIRTNRYKLIWNLEAGIINVPGDVMHSPVFPLMIGEITQERPYFELYDLLEDPNEKTNLASDPQYTDVFENLRLRLYNWMQETNDPLLNGPTSSPFNKYGSSKLKGKD